MSQPVRVRFAPSPTGFLHIGGMRSALFNWLWARHTGGTFVLRIEDTDRNRLVEGALDQIIAAHAALGILPDEGPAQGGEYGPYIQSERQSLYHDHAEQREELALADPQVQVVDRHHVAAALGDAAELHVQLGCRCHRGHTSSRPATDGGGPLV